MKKAYKIPHLRVKDLLQESNFLNSVFVPEQPSQGSDMDIDILEPGLWG